MRKPRGAPRGAAAHQLGEDLDDDVGEDAGESEPGDDEHPDPQLIAAGLDDVNDETGLDQKRNDEQ